MGVHHLWSILEPSKQEESIDQLRGKTLCIDLSLWICEAQGTKGLRDQLKPYLRNVFFRTMYLASLGVRPVFVVDGVPPEIKRETIVKRLQARGAHVSTNVQKQRKLNRSKFTMQCNEVQFGTYRFNITSISPPNFLVCKVPTECCEMMGLLGVPFVKSDGEAEAMCAWLNENNYADGVLTDDGDVFLYGAKVVYKDFNVSSCKNPTDHLQVFRLEEIKSSLGLTRRNMVALALLLGCDYLPAGVPGVGKETAIKLLTSLTGVDLLDRFDEWKLSPDVHPDSLTSSEVAVKRKAVKLTDFPNKAVIKEFLSPKVGNVNANFRWKCPDLEGIKEFFFRKLDWPKEYTEEKMLILVTDWQLVHMNPSKTSLFFPARIVKPRVRQGKDCYEIEWNTEDQTSKWPKTFVNVKLKEIICKTFPRLVEKFETELATKKNKGKLKKSQKSKTSTDKPDFMDDLLTKMNCMDLNENTNMAEHSSDDCKEKRPTRKTFEGGESAREPECDRHQESTNYQIKDNSSAGELIKCSQTSQGKNFNAGDEFEYLDSIEDVCVADFVSITTKEQTSISSDEMTSQDHGTSSCKSESLSIIDSQHILPNLNILITDVCESTDGLNSPIVDEQSVYNLADITIDQTFGSELGAVDDLLSDSFIASLQAVTPVHHRNQRLQCTQRVHGNSNSNSISFEPNPVPNRNLSTFEDEIFTDSLLNLNITSSEFNGKESSIGLDGLDDKDEFCKEARTKSSVNAFDTPSPREATSLASRLLKRFQTENRTNMADSLRFISGESALVYSEYKVNNSAKSSANRNKPNERYADEVVHINGSFTSILTKGTELKSTKAKPMDIIVLD